MVFASGVQVGAPVVVHQVFCKIFLPTIKTTWTLNKALQRPWPFDRDSGGGGVKC